MSDCSCKVQLYIDASPLESFRLSQLLEQAESLEVIYSSLGAEACFATLKHLPV